MNNKIIYHSGGHLGDCVHTLHFIRKCKIPFEFYINDEYHFQIIDILTEEEKEIIKIKSIRDYIGGGVDSWIGSNLDRNKLYNYYHEDFFIDWFDQISYKLSIENPIKTKEDFLMDSPEILNRENKMGKKYDYLIINSIPLSGQISYNFSLFCDIINLISERNSLVLTRNVGDFDCTLDNRLTLTDIGRLSLDCNNILSVHTAPQILTINKWNIDKCNWITLQGDGIQYNFDRPSRFTTYKTIKECFDYLRSNLYDRYDNF